MDTPDTSFPSPKKEIPAAVLSALQHGDQIGAIKELRSAFGIGMFQAREMVEEYARHQGGESRRDILGGGCRRTVLPVVPQSPWYAAPLLSLRCTLLRRILRSCHVALKCQYEVPEVFAIEGYTEPAQGVTVRHIVLARQAIFLWTYQPSSPWVEPMRWDEPTVNDFLRKYMKDHLQGIARILALHELKKSIPNLVRDGEFRIFEEGTSRYEQKLDHVLTRQLNRPESRLMIGLFMVLAFSQRHLES